MEKLKPSLISAGAAVAILILTQLILPGGRSGGGTPPAILFTGLVNGTLNALLAVGIILIYRNIRIINFAQAAMGGAGGVFAYNLSALLHWPFLISFVFGVVVAALLGVVIELAFIRRFFNAPRLVLTVITIALLGFVQAAQGFISTLPIFPDVQDRTQEELLGTAQIVLPFEDFTFRIAGYPLTFGFPHVFALVLSAVALISLTIFLRYTKLGVAIRAASENSDRARLLGISVGSLSLTVWTIAGVLSGLGVILAGTITGAFRGGGASPQILMTALVAAVLARMTSIPIGVFSAIAITVVREAVRHSFESQVALVDVGLFVLVLVGLLIQRDRVARSESGDYSAWKATDEYRSIPKEMNALGTIRLWRRALIVLGLVMLLGFPWVGSPRQVNLGGYVMIIAIVTLSLVVLTGWAGQVSLGQFAIVAIGAVVGGAVTTRFSFWIAILAVPVITAGFSILIGLPALRIRGLFLGITTFALSYAVQAALFREEYFGWILPEGVERPTLLLLDFQEERSMYYLCLVALVLTILLVTTLRRSRAGRVLIGLRENESNLQSFGINLIRTRLSAFALSGFICGFAGVLLAVHQRAVQQASFEADLSLRVFLYSVIGGVGSVSGTLMGALYFAVNQFIPEQSILSFFAGEAGILAILYFVPGGLGAMFFGLRDGILRIVAQRRQIVVPSLFADFDPLALSRRLIPLSEPLAGTGLAALPFSQRYRVSSELYGGRGKLTLTGESISAMREREAFGAAAKAVESDGHDAIPEAPQEPLPPVKAPSEEK